MEFIDLEKLVDFASYQDLDSNIADCAVSDEYAKMFGEDDGMDSDYRCLLSYILTVKSQRKSPKKRRENENVDELDTGDESNESDPQYAIFLKSLRAHEKSYVIEGERNGSSFVIKYEGDVSSDEECEVEYKRKSRSAKKQKNGFSENHKRNLRSTSSGYEEAVNLSRMKLRNRAAKGEKKPENMKEIISTDEIVLDPDYNLFLSKFKVVEGRGVFEYGDQTVVFEVSDGERNRERVDDDDDDDDDDEWDDDVRILDGPYIGTGGNFNSRTTVANIVHRNSEYRRQLTAILRKPYDEEEFDKLWFDIEFRKPQERHIELRHGRERSHSTNKCGKSYLDYHPDLRRKLALSDDDRPKCLNLLRGFFFWLKKASQEESFHPWLDAECLAINPEPG